jgi:16S rRNA (uracil1498-N3)-methyltransferase
VPDIAQPVGFTAALELARGSAALVLTEPSAPVVSSAVSVLDGVPTEDGVVVFVGPEGGWSAPELTEAAEAGARLVTLGDRTLRADAMALVALPVLLYVWGEL